MNLTRKQYERRRADILKLYEAGAMLVEIAEVFGMSASRVSQILDQYTSRARWLPAPTVKSLTPAERDKYRPQWVAIAQACERAWAEKTRDLPAAKPKTRAAGAE